MFIALLLAGACGSAPAPDASPPPDGVTLTGVALAGPVCPVQQFPPDPACDDRPVPEAVGVVETPDGEEVARFSTGADGRFTVVLAPGVYVLIPQAVEGLLGTAAPVNLEVPTTGPVTLLYDTGIR